MIQVRIVCVFISLFIFISHVGLLLSYVMSRVQHGDSVSITPFSTICAQCKSYFVGR